MNNIKNLKVLLCVGFFAITVTNDIANAQSICDFPNALSFSSQGANLSACSLANTSASSVIGDVVQNRIINPAKQQKKGGQNPNVFLADLKYEHGEFRQTNEEGNIGGLTGGTSVQLGNNTSVGAFIPYDYLDFDNFYGHRTGIILYGKKAWNLPNNIELSTAINANYMYTDSQSAFSSNQLSTYGGGFSTRLLHDNGGKLVPAATFSIQYNEDNMDHFDNNQYLVKIGSSLGYRVTDNLLVQALGLWTKDATDRPTGLDTDFYDVGIEGNWSVSDMWQLKGGFKKMLDYDIYDSETFYLGNSFKF